MIFPERNRQAEIEHAIHVALRDATAAGLGIMDMVERVSLTALNLMNGVALAVFIDAPGSERTPAAVYTRVRGALGSDVEAGLDAIEQVSRAVFSSPVAAAGTAVGEVRLYFAAAGFRDIFPLDVTEFLGRLFGPLLWPDVVSRAGSRPAYDLFCCWEWARARSA